MQALKAFTYDGKRYAAGDDASELPEGVMRALVNSGVVSGDVPEDKPEPDDGGNDDDDTGEDSEPDDVEPGEGDEPGDDDDEPGEDPGDDNEAEGDEPGETLEDEPEASDDEPSGKSLAEYPLPPVIVERLAEAGIKTDEDAKRHYGESGKFDDIDNIGPAISQRLKGALDLS